MTPSFSKLVLALALFLGLEHFFWLLRSGSWHLLAPSLVAYIHDLMLLVWIGAIFGGIRLMTVKKGGNFLPWVLGVFLSALGGFLALYPGLLSEFLSFPVNIFQSDWHTSKNMASEYMGFKILFPSLLVFVTGILTMISGVEFKLGKKPILWTLGIITVLGGFFLTAPSPNPLVYSFQEAFKTLLSGKSRVVPSLSVAPSLSGSSINFLTRESFKESKFHTVLIIVLEGIRADDFEKDFLTLKNGFYEKNRSTSVYFDDYHTTNLDSYTSLLAMTTGIQVPFRAYSNPPEYQNLNQAPNLVEYYKESGYHTSFFSTFAYNPFVPNESSWDAVFAKPDLGDVSHYTTIGSSKMEQATEDTSALPKMLETMTKQPKALVMHELAYGHSPDWQAKMGKTPLEYYDHYLQSLTDGLGKNHVLEQTLLVIVSDHGNRALPQEAENYRVPLLLVGSGVTLYQAHSHDFFNHLGLVPLISGVMQGKEVRLKQNQIFTVGSTGKWVYGAISNHSGSVFLDAQAGTILSESGILVPKQIYDDFQSYTNQFHTQFGKK